ncbi:MAG: response regulator transcription factor [Deltaproteobacteria bacterium]|nr:response regulator transcription factor [Deltaproteobacteria bacterium]
MPSCLVVEDCPVYRQVVCDILHRHFPGLLIAEAEDAREATEKARSSKPDLVLMDLQLPDENGLEVARRIWDVNPLATVVVVTSYDIPEYREAAAQLGVRHFLVKSTSTPKELVALTSTIFEERALAGAQASGVLAAPATGSF